MRVLAMLAAVLVSALVWAGPALAHPHIFIEHRVEILFDGKGPTGVRLTWKFDELYSATIRTNFTQAQAGPLSAQDSQTLHDKNFVKLASQHYFTRITLDDAPLALGEPRDFTASDENGRIVYRFTLPLTPPPVTGQATLEIAIFDPEYYVDYEIATDHPVIVTNGAAVGAQCSAGTAMHNASVVGDFVSDLVTCLYHG